MNALSKWLNDRPYTKAMYISALATFVMAIMSGIMCYTVVQNAQSIRLTRESLAQSKDAVELTRRAVSQSELALAAARESLEIQKNEFALRNRPIVVLRNMHFGGESLDTAGRKHPRSVQFEMVNISQVPANRLHGYSRAILNGSVVANTTVTPAALANAGTASTALLLSEAVYSQATNETAKFQVETEIKYSGMLGEADGAFRSYERSIYNPPLGKFQYDEVEYK